MQLPRLLRWGLGLGVLAACSPGEPDPGAGPGTDASQGTDLSQGTGVQGTAHWPVGFEFPEGEEPAYDRVVLVTIDTLRADHLSCYGYLRPTSPFLDSLCKRSVVFERAMAAVSHTAPSHASILTGLPPMVHGVFHNGDTLDPRAQDLGALFGGAGYKTAAFVNTTFLRSVASTFQHRDNRPGLSENVVDAAIRWLEAPGRTDRFFLWVHSFDPHHWPTTRSVPKEDLKAIRDATELDDDELYDYLAGLMGLPNPPRDEPFRMRWESKFKRKVESRRDYLDLIDGYDALILHADREVGRLYAALEALELPGRTLWVITSDHGEGIGSHGVVGHGGYLYQEQLRVPLIVHATDDSLVPRRVTEVVQHVDLFPTFADLLGARTGGVDPRRSGASLRPLLEGADWTPRPAFSHRRPQTVTVEELELHDEQSWSAVYTLQTPDSKYVLRRSEEDEFYDLASDPLELENKIAKAGRKGAALRDEIEERVRLYLALRREAYQGEGINDEVLEELRALGYVE